MTIKSSANVAHDRIREEDRQRALREVNDRCDLLERQCNRLVEINNSLIKEIDEIGAAIPEHLISRTNSTIAEDIKALVSLPVLTRCGDCRWCHSSEVCMHPKAHPDQEIDGSSMPPPTWCPLRGDQ